MISIGSSLRLKTSFPRWSSRFATSWSYQTTARPIHPGELLKEEIEYRGIRQAQLAKQMGVSATLLNDILNERRALTPTTALLFEAALGVSSDLLMGMQTDYAMRLIKEDRSLATRLARIRESAALL